MNVLRISLVSACLVLAGCASSGGGSSSGTSKHQYSAREHNSIWERIREGYGMADLNDPKVDYWLRYYTNRPQSVEQMAARSSKYIYYVTTELEKRNMPTELALLPFVESAYKTNAYSSSKAAGLWQFIPSTGTEYHLNQDWWGDDRRDPVHSTRAALDYLTYLHDFQGGDWHLALASYNWGQNAVKRARDRNAARGLGTDFLSLNMPNETRNYVPKLLALKKIISNPAQYGVNLPAIPDTPYFAEYRGKQDINVDVAARLAGMSLEEFKELNASSARPVILASRKHILIPKAKLASFKANLKKYKGQLSTWTSYQPTTGESLASIADNYGVSVDQLKSLNGYRSNQNVALSSRPLLLPKVSGNPAPSAPQPAPVRQQTPDVMLASNTRNSVVPATPKASAVTSSAPAIQQPQVVASTASATSLAANNVTDTSDPLDGLVNSRDVTEANTRASAAQYQTRRVSYSPSTSAVAAQPAARHAVYQASASTSHQPQTHRVLAGETMFSLAKRYGTTVQNLSALNNITPGGLKAGMTLRLPGSGIKG